MQAWWKDLVKEIQSSEDQELDGKLTRIIDKSIDVINDRLTNGEFILDSRSGKIKRVPVKLRDTHRVTSDLLDKRNVLRGRPTSITERISTEDVLKKLALQFEEFTKFKQTRLIDAVHDERDTGLQEGESEIRLQTDSQEEAGGTEQGSPTDGNEVGAQHNGGCGSHSSSLERGQSEQVIELASLESSPQPLFQAE